MYLVIKNKGILNPEHLSLIGYSTKRDDPNTIGEFGSGLKYGVTKLVRDKHPFGLLVDGKEILIEEAFKDVDGVEVGVLQINGKETSISTLLGPGWHAEHAIREIVCNARDASPDDFSYSIESSVPKGKKGWTVFYIQWSGDYKIDLEKWFAWDRKPVYKHNGFKVYTKSADETRVYKQGVLVYTDNDKKSFFDYDIDALTINELREGNYWNIVGSLCYHIVRIGQQKFIKNWLTLVSECNSSYMEDGIEFDYAHIHSESALAKVVTSTPITDKSFDDKQDSDKKSGALKLPTTLFKRLCQQNIIEGTLMYKNGKSFTLSIVKGDVALMERAIDVMRELELGQYVDECTFHWAKFSDANILGTYKDNKVYISVKHQESVFEWMLQTMFEELMHHKTGYSDDRRFQDYFIGWTLKLLMEKHNVGKYPNLPKLSDIKVFEIDNDEMPPL